MCLHLFSISDLTFRDSFGSANIIYVFSVRHTSQNLAPGVYFPAFAMIFHVISNNIVHFSSSFTIFGSTEEVVITNHEIYLELF